MSKVFFFDFKDGEDVLDGIAILLGEVSREYGKKGKRLQGKKTAVKAHFGELGNYTHIRPAFVRRVVDFVKEMGGDPFATETTALYPGGGRQTVEESLRTAAYNGFTEAGLECPIVIADGPDGYNGVSSKVCRSIGLVKVARAIADADAMIVVSHVKGHLLSGMGGAIKNLAMGCTTKDCKRAQHRMHGITFDFEKCAGCGKCADVCSFSAIRMEGGRPVRDEERCFYCLTCKFSCDYDAIDILDGGKEKFQAGLAEAAAGVMEVLNGKEVIFVNFIFDITPLCDCAAPAGRLVAQNVGILASADPVAIDAASIHLVDNAELLGAWGVSPPDVLGKINGTSSWIQVKEAERLGLGTKDYRMLKV